MRSRVLPWRSICRRCGPYSSETQNDPSGSAAYNMQLGQARADAVKEYLGSSLGGATVRAVSYGETRNRQIMERIPAGRWGDPKDIGGAAVFLASSASDYVQGHILAVDGLAKEKEELKPVQELIEQAIVDTRSLTFELSPPVLYELGLVPAVEWLTRKIQQEHGIQTRFHDDGQPKPVDENFKVVLFQAVRELLVNVVKHAQASQAQVLLRRDGDAMRIIIEDDGIGFEVAKTRSETPRTFGLFNIRERVEYLGGRLRIRSEGQCGTRVTLIAPLNIESERGKE